jgi:hypothetical protein
VAVGNDHQALARIRRRTDTIGLVTCKPRRPDQPGHGTEFVRGKKSWQSRGLDREGCLQFEKILQVRQRRRVGRGQAQPVTKQFGIDRGLAGIRITNRRMIEQIRERKAGLVAGQLEPIMKLLAKRDMKRAIDKVVGILDADLTARLREVTLRGRRRAQGVPRRGRPRG